MDFLCFNMFKKGTKLYSVTKHKCPRCHEGEFFENSFTFNPSKISQIHEHCPHCGLKYMIEPSFFYGAMYVNYGITVAISIAVFIIAKVIIGLTLVESFFAIFGSLILSGPFNIRLARILYINFFVDYEEKFTKKNE